MALDKKSKGIQEDKSGLDWLAQVPKVGLGYDIALWISHRYALEIAGDTLSGTSEDERSEIYISIDGIFSQWQEEYGIYPPNTGRLFGLGSNEWEPAKDYCARISMEAKAKGEEPKLPDPWECCPYVNTRLGLFWKLCSDDYKPLINYLEKNLPRYQKIIAILIILTDEPEAQYQSSDCIMAALRLASLRISSQGRLIKKMKPDAEAAFNRRKRKQISAKIKKEHKLHTILAVYEDLRKEKGEGNFPLKNVAERTGIPESTVSKYLRKAGLARYKIK